MFRKVIDINVFVISLLSNFPVSKRFNLFNNNVGILTIFVFACSETVQYVIPHKSEKMKPRMLCSSPHKQATLKYGVPKTYVSVFIDILCAYLGQYLLPCILIPAGTLILVIVMLIRKVVRRLNSAVEKLTKGISFVCQNMVLLINTGVLNVR